jgi:hypothetical protein
MTKKSKPPKSDDQNLSNSERNDHNYEVEEMVFSRQNYDSTASFIMDIDKAKKITLNSGKVPSSDEADNPEAVKLSKQDQNETDDIKKTLAELREAEMDSEEDNDSDSGLWVRFKNLFSR